MMNKKRWNYIKNLKPSPGRYIHISKPLTVGSDPFGNPIMVVAKGKGITYRKAPDNAL